MFVDMKEIEDKSSEDEDAMVLQSDTSPEKHIDTPLKRPGKGAKEYAVKKRRKPSSNLTKCVDKEVKVIAALNS